MDARDTGGGQYALLRVPELKKIAAQRGLDTQCTKHELLQRLLAADRQVNGGPPRAAAPAVASAGAAVASVGAPAKVAPPAGAGAARAQGAANTLAGAAPVAAAGATVPAPGPPHRGGASVAQPGAGAGCGAAAAAGTARGVPGAGRYAEAVVRALRRPTSPPEPPLSAPALPSPAQPSAVEASLERMTEDSMAGDPVDTDPYYEMVEATEDPYGGGMLEDAGEEEQEAPEADGTISFVKGEKNATPTKTAASPTGGGFALAPTVETINLLDSDDEAARRPSRRPKPATPDGATPQLAPPQPPAGASFLSQPPQPTAVRRQRLRGLLLGVAKAQGLSYRELLARLQHPAAGKPVRSSTAAPPSVPVEARPTAAAAPVPAPVTVSAPAPVPGSAPATGSSAPPKAAEATAADASARAASSSSAMAVDAVAGVSVRTQAVAAPTTVAATTGAIPTPEAVCSTKSAAAAQAAGIREEATTPPTRQATQEVAKAGAKAVEGPATSSGKLAGAEVPDAAYRSPVAPIALMRAYCSQDRWVGLRDGFILFEDDAVQYPAATPTLIRVRPLEDRPRLDLASLWLLAALRSRYEECVTLELLRLTQATRVAKEHVPGLLDFLLGRRDRCDLLAPHANSAGLESEPRRALQPRIGAFRQPPLSPEELRQAPDAGTEPGGLATSLLRRQPRSTWGPAAKAAAAAAASVAPTPQLPASLPGQRSMAERLERLRRDIAAGQKQGQPAAGSGALQSASQLPVVPGGRTIGAYEPLAPEPESAEVAAAAARVEAAKVTKDVVQAEADLQQLEGEEALVARLLEECEARLEACSKEVVETLARGRRLRTDFEKALAAALEGRNSESPPEDAKRRRLGGCGDDACAGSAEGASGGDAAATATEAPEQGATARPPGDRGWQGIA